MRRGKKTQKTQDWFTRQCKARRDLLKQCSKDLAANPFDKLKRQRFVKARVAYKKVCRKTETAYRHRLTEKPLEIGQNDPKTFWSTINKMNNWGKTKVDLADNISSEKWTKHFQTLLNGKQRSPYPLDEGPGTFEPILDSRITITATRCLK